jgi:hypothetical protein
MIDGLAEKVGRPGIERLVKGLLALFPGHDDDGDLFEVLNRWYALQDSIPFMPGIK